MYQTIASTVEPDVIVNNKKKILIHFCLLEKKQEFFPNYDSRKQEYLRVFSWVIGKFI